MKGKVLAVHRELTLEGWVLYSNLNSSLENLQFAIS